MAAAGNPFAPSSQTEARVSTIRAAWPRIGLVAVVGAGRSGRAAADLCRAHGVEVQVFDDRPQEPAVRPLSPASLRAADLVVLSPGVPRAHPALRDVIAEGRVVAEVELAAWFLKTRLVGVTGTNGKSTTTALIAHGFQRAGYRVFAGGNLGAPLSTLARDPEGVDVAVVELSSYQLESVVSLSLEASVWLNLQPDHLDRYPSEDVYAQAKLRIVEITEPAGTVVLNADDDRVRAAATHASASVAWFGRSSLPGPGVQIQPDGWGVAAGVRHPLQSAALLGPHNHDNAAASICVWSALGVEVEAIDDAVLTFPGLPHRLERVPTTDGRAWFNDSKATNVAAAIVALNAVSGAKTLIVGGRAKAEPKDPLVQAAARSDVQHVLAIGESARDWIAAFADRVPGEIVSTLEEAVQRARSIDTPVVLLSPACASFDQFSNFEERGDRFRSLVREQIR